MISLIDLSTCSTATHFVLIVQTLSQTKMLYDLTTPSTEVNAIYRTKLHAEGQSCDRMAKLPSFSLKVALKTDFPPGPMIQHDAFICAYLRSLWYFLLFDFLPLIFPLHYPTHVSNSLPFHFSPLQLCLLCFCFFAFSVSSPCLR